MKANPVSIVIFLCGLFSVSARAADPVVAVKGIPPSETVIAGNVAVFTVELDIRKPFHINSNKPLEEYLIPTSLEFEPEPDVEFGKILFPVAEIKEFSFTDSPMAVYEGIVKIPVEVTPSAGLSGKDVVLKGSVHYQACDNSTCLPPTRESFTVALSVGRSSGIQTGAPKAASSFGPPDNGIGSSGSADSGKKSLPVYVLLVFLSGLALNLTPCVYPMIPITITYFGGQAQGKKGSLLAHSGLYVVGMAVTYSVLGVVAALTGGLLGAALRYPPVLIGIALVMVFLALSMFDVYELRMPAFLNRLAGGTRKGYTGTFLMGLTVGIVAAPCIGPFVFGLLTYVGNRGNAVLGFLLFFVLALGLGIPLLVLAIFSGSIQHLPRSGEWMIWVRKVFGFILLAMAAFFLKTLFPNPLIFPLTLALISVLAGVYLAWITPVATTGKGFVWFRNIVGIGFFTVALIVTVTGLQSYIRTVVEDEMGNTSLESGLRGNGGIEWSSFSEQLLDEASKEGKPVLIDFYADWCAPCKELEKHTFAAPEVVELSRRFVMLKADLTLAGNPIVEDLRVKYRILGVPTLIFLRPDLSEIDNLRVMKFEPADAFLPKMEEAYRSVTGAGKDVEKTGCRSHAPS